MIGYFKCYKNDKLVDEGHNLVVNNGRKWYIDRWVGTGSVQPWDVTHSMLGLGESSGTTYNNTSGLGAELGTGSNGRSVFNTITRTVDAGSTIIGSVSFSNVLGTVSELGVFVTGYDSIGSLRLLGSGAETGILFGRRLFTSPIALGSGDVFNVTYSYTQWDV